MMVARRWPTCICLATFTPQRSMTTACGSVAGGMPKVADFESSSTRAARNPGSSVTLMKPGPATSHFEATPARSAALRISSASARGLVPRSFASDMAAFTWKSPNFALPLTRICGSKPSLPAAAAPPMTVRIAARKRASSSVAGSQAGRSGAVDGPDGESDMGEGSYRSARGAVRLPSTPRRSRKCP